MRAIRASLAITLLVGCAEQVCVPEEHGSRCGVEPGTYTVCTSTKDIGTCTALCDPELAIVTRSCPAARPSCIAVDVPEGDAPDAACIGDVIGTCDASGFVRCEDNAIVECVRTGDSFVLSRGDCGSTARCAPEYQTCWPL